MKTIEIYGVNTASDDTAPKGSASNPYTYKEFDSMMNNGTWEGGYVEGYGYMDKGVTITGTSEDSEDSYSWEDPWSSLPSDPWESGSEDASGSNGEQGGGGKGSQTGETNKSVSPTNPYPQTSKTVRGVAYLYKWAENIGINSTFSYEYSISISGYKMFLWIGCLNTYLPSAKYNAVAYLYFENGGKEEYSLKYDSNGQGCITQNGVISIGDCTIALPKYGLKKITLVIGYIYDSSTGYVSDRTDEIQIYPF